MEGEAGSQGSLTALKGAHSHVRLFLLPEESRARARAKPLSGLCSCALC
jgi:hypothetical protein